METNKIAKHQFVKLANETRQRELDGGKFIWQVVEVKKDRARIVPCGIAPDLPRSIVVALCELRLATRDELKAY